MSPLLESDPSQSTVAASSRRCGVVVESAERRHLGVGERAGSEHGRIPVAWRTSQGRAVRLVRTIAAYHDASHAGRAAVVGAVHAGGGAGIDSPSKTSREETRGQQLPSWRV